MRAQVKTVDHNEDSESLLKELERGPTWKEVLPYATVYIAAVLAVAWGFRYLPEDIADAWWIHPTLLVDGLILVIIAGVFLWSRRNADQIGSDDQKLRMRLANNALENTRDKPAPPQG
jgi:uncharacterized membrane protein YfcA